MSMSIEDYDLIVTLGAGGCSLNRSPRSNWVEKNGGLPGYICQIARAINGGKGHDVSSSIAIAVSRAKAWAHGANKVTPKTQAKAAAAVAQWEALKAHAHAGHVVKATNSNGETFIQLSVIGSFNTNIVRDAWEAQQRAQREAEKAADANGTDDDSNSPSEAVEAAVYSWVTELWTDYIIVRSSTPQGEQLWKVAYTVDDDGDQVIFDKAVPVTVQYVPDVETGDDNEDLSDEEKKLLGLDGTEFFLSAQEKVDPLDKIIGVYKQRRGL